MKRLFNADLAELLARKAEQEEGIRQRAYKRAARSAFLWPIQAADLFAEGRSLLELKSAGPFIAHQLRGWLDQPKPPDSTKRSRSIVTRIVRT